PGLSLGAAVADGPPPPTNRRSSDVDAHPALPVPPPRPEAPPRPPARGGAGGPPGADLAAVADLPGPAQPAAPAAEVEPDGRLLRARLLRLLAARPHLRVSPEGPGACEGSGFLYTGERNRSPGSVVKSGVLLMYRCSPGHSWMGAIVGR